MVSAVRIPWNWEYDCAESKFAGEEEAQLAASA